MPGKVYLRDGETLEQALKRFRLAVKDSGIRVMHPRFREHNKPRCFFERPGIRRRRKKLAAKRMQRIMESRRRYLLEQTR